MARLTRRFSLVNSLRALVAPQLLFWAGLVAGVTALEVLGRRSPHDGYDLLGVFAIVMGLRLVGSVSAVAVPWRSAWTRWLRQRLVALRHGLTHQVGLDLRGDSNVPLRPVPLFSRLDRIAWTALAAAAALAWWSPEGLRSTLAAGSTTIYFVALGLLLAALLGGTLVAGLVCFWLLHDGLVRSTRLPRARRRRLTILLTLLYLALVLNLGLWLGAPAGLVLPALALIIAHLYPRRPVGKPLMALVRSARGELYRVPFTTFVRQANLWICCAVLTLGLLAGGAIARPTTELELTRQCGLAFLWASGPLLVLVLGRGLHLLWMRPRLDSPGGERRRTAWLLAEPGRVARAPQAHARLAERLRLGGWQLHVAPTAPRPQRADLVLQVKEWTPEPLHGPLPGETPVVTIVAADLADPQLPRRLDRWDHVWKRRQLNRRLRRLFKIAAAREYRRGSGFLFAPQYWFVTGLTRDEDEEGLTFEGPSDGCIGPPYRELFGVRLRRYLREVLEHAEIDLIYLEDGVGYRGLKRVLGVLFENHDVHGGRCRAEERHFVGLPEVAVHIDDFGLDRDRHLPQGYPEPDYDGVGRARILVVQRFRGGDDEAPEPPPEPADEEEWTWLREALSGLTPRRPLTLGT